MHTLHVPFHYYPDAVGGTEVYVRALALCLAQAGGRVDIAAPGQERVDYEHEGLAVHRFTTGPLKDISGLYGEGDSLAALQFGEIMDQVRPDLVHLHGVSPAISLRLLRQIGKRGVPVLLTAHIPGILCYRGTLLRYGAGVCDGKAEVRRCAGCTLESRGLYKPLAQLMGILPAAVGAGLSATGYQSNWMTALRMSHLMSARLAAIKCFLDEVDHIVAVSEWLGNLLVRNGVPPFRITVCRHGATQSDPIPFPAFRPRSIQPSLLRTAFVGRLREAKGAHVLIEGIVRSPHLAVELDVYGIVQEGSDSYRDRLARLAGQDRRIRFLAPLPNDDVPRALQEYDVVAIPSLWMETGPLVVYDAFAAGVPVVGSRRGGIAELVTHEVNGLLVDPPEDPQAWSDALSRLCAEPGLAGRLRNGIGEVRTMSSVAGEMARLYESLLTRRVPGQPANRLM